MAHILVIDDEPHIRNILEKLLSRDGHRVDTAENGLIVGKLGKQFSYDLVITDLVMPEIDGFEVINEIKQMTPQIPIIVITGGSARLDRDYLLSMARLMPVCRVVAKPINFDEFCVIVQEVLRDKLVV